MALPAWQATIVNEFGDIIPSPVITVIVEATGLPATLFSNRGGTTPLGSGGVFTAGVDGFAQFFAAPAEYRVTASDAGSGFSQTWDFVNLYIPQSNTTDTKTGAGLTVGSFGLGTAAATTSTPDAGTVSGLLSAVASDFDIFPSICGSAVHRVDYVQVGEACYGVCPNTGKFGIRRRESSAWLDWEEPFTDENFQPGTVEGIGARIVLRATSPVSSGGTTAGSNLTSIEWNSGGALVSTGVAQTGVYRLVQSADLSGSESGMFVKES